jgi:hypothetical protein
LPIGGYVAFFFSSTLMTYTLYATEPNRLEKLYALCSMPYANMMDTMTR